MKEWLTRESTVHVLACKQAYEVDNPLKRQSFSRVIVEVLDINDHSPSFTNTNSNFTITENAVVGTIITRLTATDKDEVI